MSLKTCPVFISIRVFVCVYENAQPCKLRVRYLSMNLMNVSDKVLSLRGSVYEHTSSGYLLFSWPLQCLTCLSFLSNFRVCWNIILFMVLLSLPLSLSHTHTACTRANRQQPSGWGAHHSSSHKVFSCIISMSHCHWPSVWLCLCVYKNLVKPAAASKASERTYTLKSLCGMKTKRAKPCKFAHQKALHLCKHALKPLTFLEYSWEFQNQ